MEQRQNYIVDVVFADSYFEYNVLAYSEDEACDAAYAFLKLQLGIVDVVDEGDGEYEVRAGVLSEKDTWQTYQVTANSAEEARKITMRQVINEVQVVDVYDAE